MQKLKKNKSRSSETCLGWRAWPHAVIFDPCMVLPPRTIARVLMRVAIIRTLCIFLFFVATMFLEIWKRRQSVISWEWDLRDFEDFQHTRPEFEAKVKTTRFYTLISLTQSLNVNIEFRGHPLMTLQSYVEWC
jgi:hypothetical protein